MIREKCPLSISFKHGPSPVPGPLPSPKSEGSFAYHFLNIYLLYTFIITGIDDIAACTFIFSFKHKQHHLVEIRILYPWLRKKPCMSINKIDRGNRPLHGYFSAHFTYAIASHYIWKYLILLNCCIIFHKMFQSLPVILVIDDWFLVLQNTGWSSSLFLYLLPGHTKESFYPKVE